MVIYFYPYFIHFHSNSSLLIQINIHGILIYFFIVFVTINKQIRENSEFFLKKNCFNTGSISKIDEKINTFTR